MPTAKPSDTEQASNPSACRSMGICGLQLISKLQFCDLSNQKGSFVMFEASLQARSNTLRNIEHSNVHLGIIRSENPQNCTGEISQYNAKSWTQLTYNKIQRRPIAYLSYRICGVSVDLNVLFPLSCKLGRTCTSNLPKTRGLYLVAPSANTG